MPWIKTGHECLLPSLYIYGEFVGSLFGGPQHPLGSVWECPDCGKHWEVDKGEYHRKFVALGEA
ncbi:hypothetical protein [Gordonia sp. (in: high G+C Gram-positive bacteria)]|uniref:hypothetical protein n=1 Tax=Gordonia sp. (in: high G+C Gram-positive bacteria) TaxID=84139 RepID=UPI003340FFC5